MACAKAIARAAEAAAIASKRAADAMAEAVAASGDSQPQPPPVEPPGKRGRKSPANVAAPTKRTLTRRASASHDTGLPAKGRDDDEASDDELGPEDDTDSESLEEGEQEGEGDHAPIRRRPAAFGVPRNPLAAASATAGTGAAVPAPA